ncbi:uncharacterized protein BDR25DRAFT_356439 [Lindgomyces ingoldianus]|uniref:Uncharacterized protein n=1 Tax=Lindgomyces ingoldianus TaxID=673940 RepID=A0ACB6QRP6_9PLEO|nr:uncharacterized protein BDR25DRAFT_356439 [Lindgomyces ingoldianus]KAF2469699.1 hypothetical protein BDR25DRAFT_356439 [Lindgomyces ingoldianus]
MLIFSVLNKLTRCPKAYHHIMALQTGTQTAFLDLPNFKLQLESRYRASNSHYLLPQPYSSSGINSTAIPLPHALSTSLSSLRQKLDRVGRKAEGTQIPLELMTQSGSEGRPKMRGDRGGSCDDGGGCGEYVDDKNMEEYELLIMRNFHLLGQSNLAIRFVMIKHVWPGESALLPHSQKSQYYTLNVPLQLEIRKKKAELLGPMTCGDSPSRSTFSTLVFLHPFGLPFNYPATSATSQTNPFGNLEAKLLAFSSLGFQRYDNTHSTTALSIVRHPSENTELIINTITTPGNPVPRLGITRSARAIAFGIIFPLLASRFSFARIFEETPALGHVLLIRLARGNSIWLAKVLLIQD